MRDYQTKSNQGGLPDSITSEKWGAGEANSILTENKTAVSSSGQTLAPSSGAGEVTDQLSKALAIYGAGGAEYCLDTGVANAYVLSPVAPRKSIPAYFDGMILSFKPGNANTGASTVNYASIGVKSITDINGNDLSANQINNYVTIRYNLASDRFETVGVYNHIINVKDHGATGDGATDDTAAVQAALTILGLTGGCLVFPPDIPDKYRVTSTLTCSLTKSVCVLGFGEIYFDNTEINYGFQFTPANEIDHLEIGGLNISGNSILSVGVIVNASTVRIGRIDIHGNTVTDLDNVSVVRSTSGIRVEADTTSIVNVTGNFVFNVNRTQVNPSVISSTGIIVTGASAGVTITGNSINGVDSPSGDADADGIAVFSDNHLASPSERTSTNPVIQGNRVVQCKGRWVKLQSGDVDVSGNYFSNVGIEIDDNFVGVDAQFGGCHIHGNIMRLSYSVGGSSATFGSLQFKDTQDWEQYSSFNNNRMIIENDVPYTVIISISGAPTFIHAEIDSNTAVAPKSETVQINNFVFADAIENLDEYTIDINDNHYPAGTGRLFRFNTAALTVVEDPIKGPLFADTFWLYVRDNNNNYKDANSDILNASDNIPYLQNFVIGGNSGFTRNGITAKGVDLTSMLPGSDFYFATDGAGSGLLNAPTGYDQQVYVRTEAGVNDRTLTTLTLLSMANFAMVRNDTAPAGYEYTGSAV